MNKKKVNLGSSILYKRPISKAKSSFNSIIPYTTTNKQVISFNFTREPYPNSNNISSVLSDLNKNKNFDSNFNHFKKIKINYPQCNSSRFSVNNIMLKNKLKKNIIDLNNYSLYSNDKDVTNKIFQNYNNNTCNISLNQHFYNIDYNENPNLKRNDTEIKVESNKINKYKDKEFKNTNNKSKDKFFPYFDLNTLTNSIPLYFKKDNTNNSNMDIDNHSNMIFQSNIAPRINKKMNKISLIKVNNNNKL